MVVEASVSKDSTDLWEWLWAEQARKCLSLAVAFYSIDYLLEWLANYGVI